MGNWLNKKESGFPGGNESGQHVLVGRDEKIMLKAGYPVYLQSAQREYLGGLLEQEVEKFPVYVLEQGLIKQ